MRNISFWPGMLVRTSHSEWPQPCLWGRQLHTGTWTYTPDKAGPVAHCVRRHFNRHRHMNITEATAWQKHTSPIPLCCLFTTVQVTKNFQRQCLTSVRHRELALNITEQMKTGFCVNRLSRQLDSDTNCLWHHKSAISAFEGSKS